jgi:hypothetical protein
LASKVEEGMTEEENKLLEEFKQDYNSKQA